MYVTYDEYKEMKGTTLYEETAEKYLDLFCKKTNTDKHYVQTWAPVVAAAHLNKCKPEAKQMLESFVDVVEY